jgi:hypothetical protein
MNNSLLNGHWVTEGMGWGKKIPRAQTNLDTTYQNLWATAKMVRKRKILTMMTYNKKSKRFQRNNLMIYLLIKQNLTIPMINSEKEIKI